MRLCALVWLAALMASAQPTPSVEVRGVLLEKATETPVKGSVSLSSFSTNSHASIETNVSGEFQVRLGPGIYTFNFEGNDQYRPVYIQVELTANDRSKNVRVLLERLGRVAGRVIDDATGEPLANVPVAMLQVRWIRGQLVTEEQPVKTDVNGRFQGAGDRTWPWVVGIMPRVVAPTGDGEHTLTKFTDADVQAVDEDYEERYWPGGVRMLGDALPAPYIADQTTDIGNIRVRKVKYRRALMRFPVQDCFPGQPFRAKFVRPRDETRDFNLWCGEDQLLKGLIPGTQYRLEIAPIGGVRPDAWRTGVLEFVVGDKNPDLRVLLMRGVDLEGRLVLAEGSAVPTKPMQLTLRQGDLWQDRRIDREGRFKFENVPLGEQIFQFFADGTHYARSVRFNGVEAPGIDHKFEWTGQGTLEVVIDDQPGTIAGAVKDDDQGVARVDVTVVPWPVPTGKSIFDVRSGATADGTGRYQVSMLPPGEYRVVAVPWEAREKLEEPGVLERLMSRAEKITLGRGSAASVDLKIVDPGR